MIDLESGTEKYGEHKQEEKKHILLVLIFCYYS